MINFIHIVQASIPISNVSIDRDFLIFLTSVLACENVYEVVLRVSNGMIPLHDGQGGSVSNRRFMTMGS